MYYDYSSATLYLISIMSYVLRKEGNGYSLMKDDLMKPWAYIRM